MILFLNLPGILVNRLVLISSVWSFGTVWLPAQKQRLHSTWMHEGGAIKVFALGLPSSGELIWETSISIQAALNHHWSADFTFSAGTPLAEDIYYTPNLMFMPELRRYLCRMVRPNRKSHAFISFYGGYRVSKTYDYGAPGLYAYPKWIGAGTGFGGDIDVFKRINLELFLGVATGMEHQPLSYGDRIFLHTLPRMRLQAVIPLW